ncbi:SH3 domain-containing protein [Streptomyces sp. NPDC090106]|uniref:SH3 domain-containing protein n=1 Tax=Streptomyces sp. NPDC090106 TaxID=3365946 RepID=UPI00381DE251
MSLRSRLSISVTAAALLAAAAATPAVANDGWEEDSRGDGGHHQQQHNPRYYKGRVTASTLNLRSAPNRGSQIIGTAYRGEIVKIFCKTPGQRIEGNPIWYLLADGTWAWGTARYIDSIGATPRWC